MPSQPNVASMLIAYWKKWGISEETWKESTESIRKLIDDMDE